MLLKKSLLCLSIYVLSSLHHITANATEPVSPAAQAANQEAVYINGIYNRIDFGKGDKISAEAFSKAMHGYLALREAGKLNEDKQLLTIADFTKSSSENRFWVIDLKANKVLFHTYVAHGQGSGEEFATAFSNNDNSHQSSLGFYVTGETYVGEHGTSLRLMGQDNGFNSAAYDRGIVVHAANYVSGDFISGNQRLGRSWGCPAVNPKLAPAIIDLLKDRTCLFIYYPQQQYLKTAYWLNKKLEHLPETGNLDFLAPAGSKIAAVSKATYVSYDSFAHQTAQRL